MRPSYRQRRFVPHLKMPAFHGRASRRLPDIAAEGICKLRAFIRPDISEDLPCSIGKFECRDALIGAFSGGAKGGDDVGFRIPTKAILDEPRKLGFTVRNVRRKCCRVARGSAQRCNAPSQGEQARINISQFLGMLVRNILSSVPFFGASQINQV
ncbi:hypothetical protein Naga_100256g5 [Nannochloropsis gaditana]|uniref:Uncharacterized protein n=1 Tax=Nannochloropsis gaditana TaxID=72520 RepID=W7U4I5_9STRA|nr:hypothetical protein Naga_100256g5 [Nannochloropsis gaditana]